MKTPLPPQREPSSERIRLTISVTPEVHQTFTKLSKATGMSLSSAMGEWLQDTLEAAEFMAEKVAQARAAPRIVAREMHAYALGLVDETGEVLQRVRDGGVASGKRLAAASPPPSNTGGKVPGQAAKPRGKRA